MKKIIRITAYVLGAVVVTAGLLILYISTMLPNVGSAPDIAVEITPERVERGKYLANHVMLCMDCHAQRDFTLFSGPPTPGTEGAGGERFDHSMNFPGVFISPNITPAGIGDWTDGEIFRLLTTGVRKNGKPIFPVMPYKSYSKLDPEDIKSVIAYLRTLEPVTTNHPASKADFPISIILNTMPEKADLAPMPDKSDLLAYGEYITTAAGCGECHTKLVNGKIVGEPFAGGFEFHFPDGSILRSANLTPHATGLGLWSEEQFVSRFKEYDPSHYTPENVNEGDYQTIMPWMMYAGMEEYDLKAIYTYLKSLPPVDNQVVKHSKSPA